MVASSIAAVPPVVQPSLPSASSSSSSTTVAAATAGSSPSILSAASSISSVASISVSTAPGISQNGGGAHQQHQYTATGGGRQSSGEADASAMYGAALSAPGISANRDGKVQLVIVTQPEQQHRARYQTEGSRGAIKDRSGNGFPVVRLVGYNKPTLLQVFIGTDVGRPAPHIFYQACRVTGKNSTACVERKINGTTVLEMELKPETGMTVTCDCVGILKERNVDVEYRFPDQTASRTKKKSTRCRMVFRTVLMEDDDKGGSSGELLLVASQPIVCTQPPGVPEICKASIAACSVEGGQELYVFGKNFLKDTRVVFQRRRAQPLADRSATAAIAPWEQAVLPNKEYLQHTHLVCTVPPYDRQDIHAPAVVKMYIISGVKYEEGSSRDMQTVFMQSVPTSMDIGLEGGIMPPLASVLSSSLAMGPQSSQQQAQPTSPYTGASSPNFKPELLESCSGSLLDDETLDRFPSAADNSLDKLPALYQLYRRRSVRLPSMDITEDSSSNMSLLGPEPQRLMDVMENGTANTGCMLSLANRMNAVFARPTDVHQINAILLQQQQPQPQIQQQQHLKQQQHEQVNQQNVGMLDLPNLAVSRNEAAAAAVVGTIFQHSKDILMQPQKPNNVVDVAIAAAAAVQLLPPANVTLMPMERGAAVADVVLAHREETKKAVQDIILNAAAEILTAQEPSHTTQKTIDTIISMSTPEMLNVAANSQQAVAQSLVAVQPLPEKMEIGPPPSMAMVTEQSLPQQLQSVSLPQPIQQPMDTSSAPVVNAAPTGQPPMVQIPLRALGVSAPQTVPMRSIMDRSRDVTAMSENELIRFICPNAFDACE
uniref:Uncharacterized protein n=1 Tax=Anopheles albimanus TaxID=7167 RepID=A0A182F9Z0_ANOAL